MEGQGHKTTEASLVCPHLNKKDVVFVENEPYVFFLRYLNVWQGNLLQNLSQTVKVHDVLNTKLFSTFINTL